MSLKLTVLMVVAAAVVGVVAYINPFEDSEERVPGSPWFYQVAENDIDFIEVTHEGERVAFRKRGKSDWIFLDPANIPPAYTRWSGIILLLGGPATRRDLTPTSTVIEDPAQYGLDDPATVITVGLTGDRSIQFTLGDETTDGRYVYGQVSGFPQLFIIADDWGNVLSRLASEPPLPKWSVKRDAEDVNEVSIYLGDANLKDTPQLQFKEQDGEWLVKDFTKDEEAIPVDLERWDKVVPLLGGPPRVEVEVPAVDDADFTEWGISDDSTGIEFRFPGTTARGTAFVDWVRFRVGSKTPDGRSYYARPESHEMNIFQIPVLTVDADWIDTLLNLYDDVPYGQETQSSATVN